MIRKIVFIVLIILFKTLISAGGLFYINTNTNYDVISEVFLITAYSQHTEDALIEESVFPVVHIPCDELENKVNKIR